MMLTDVYDTTVLLFLLALVDRAFWRRWSLIVQADVTHGIFESLKVRAFLPPFHLPCLSSSLMPFLRPTLFSSLFFFLLHLDRMQFH